MGVNKARGELIVEHAMSWIDTPYRHQASVRGVGCDCLGLIRGVWRNLYETEPETLPYYSSDWAETGRSERLISALSRHFTPIDLSKRQIGDVLVFRMQTGVPAKHTAIYLGNDMIIHAYWGRAVVKSRLTAFWSRRLDSAFAFPKLRPKRDP